MAELNKANPLHWILGVSLVLIGLFVLITLVLVKSQAETDTDVTISNATPVVNTLYLTATSNGADDLAGNIPEASAGNTSTIYARGTASDANGDLDLVSAEGNVTGNRNLTVRLYMTSGNCASVNDDDYRDCRWKKVGSGNPPEGDGDQCTVDPGDPDTSVAFVCPIEIRYDMAATDAAADTYAEYDWTVSAKYTDGNNSESAALTDTGYDITTFNGISVTASIDFGTLSLSGNTANADSEEVIITQQANNVVDVTLYGDNMLCTIGTVLIGKMEWSLTEVNYGSGTDVVDSVTPETILGLNLPENTSNTAQTKSIYFDLGLPSTGVGGSCDGALTIASVSN